MRITDLCKLAMALAMFANTSASAADADSLLGRSTTGTAIAAVSETGAAQVEPFYVYA